MKVFNKSNAEVKRSSSLLNTHNNNQITQNHLVKRGGELLQTSVPDTYLWSAPLLCGLACRARLETNKFCAI